MTITIHRGLTQIGGCITEISTATTRIFIDFGQNLPGNGTPTTPEQDKALVEEIFAQNSKENQAVFYTHAHEDHVGLFGYIPQDVPQYIGEAGKEMLLAKYELIKKRHELDNAIADKEFVLQEDSQKIETLKSFQTWERTKPNSSPCPMTVGDIRITPFFNCHSIYDSYMFLIEAEGERIWHMGDYREHGYLGKGLLPTLKTYAKDIDVLITEGTMLNRDDKCIHEREVSRKMAEQFSTHKYVVVLASATDIERLASIKEACKKAKKGLFICSEYMNRTMEIFSEREGENSKGLFEFKPRYVSQRDRTIPTMRKRGFVMTAGVNKLQFIQELCQGLDPNEVLLVYSSWDGYYKEPAQIEANPSYKRFRDAFQHVVDIHTSGHADRDTIQKVIDTVQAKKVICIHKEADAKL